MQTLFASSSGIRIALLTSTSEADALIELLEGIAADLCWQPGNQLRACRDGAQHLAVLAGDNIIGGLQVVTGQGNALPFRLVWPEVEMGRAPAAHVTILALAQECRGRPHLFGSLCVELWRLCVARGVEQIVLEATPPTLRLYRRIGWPLEIIGDLRPHWDEDCHLCRMSVRHVAEALSQKARRSASHRALVEQAYRDQLQSA